VTVDELLALLVSGAGVLDSADEAGNAVDQLQHALQCAEVLAADGADDTLVAAGLVHDVGHLVGHGFHVDDHEQVGADLVRPLLGERVAHLVALHVPAKRYLAAAEDYSLSSGSTMSLAVQGGPMTQSERTAFEADPCFEDAVRLRRADEAAKDPAATPAPLAEWRAVLERAAR
jgi:predicted HD phosphohydrolase